MGQPYGGFPKELQKIVLKDIEPLTDRPGKSLPPVDFESIKKHLVEKYNYGDKSEDCLLYTSQHFLSTDFLYFV